MAFLSFKNLFNKLLVFIILCLTGSGGVAVFLIKHHVTKMAYKQISSTFESDYTNISTLLIHERERLITTTQRIVNDKDLLVAVAAGWRSPRSPAPRPQLPRP